MGSNERPVPPTLFGYRAAPLHGMRPKSRDRDAEREGWARSRGAASRTGAARAQPFTQTCHRDQRRPGQTVIRSPPRSQRLPLSNQSRFRKWTAASRAPRMSMRNQWLSVIRLTIKMISRAIPTPTASLSTYPTRPDGTLVCPLHLSVNISPPPPPAGPLLDVVPEVPPC